MDGDNHWTVDSEAGLDEPVYDEATVSASGPEVQNEEAADAGSSGSANELAGTDGADAEDEDYANTTDESTALLLRVTEMEVTSHIRKARHRREVQAHASRASVLSDEKQMYANAIEDLKQTHVNVEEAHLPPSRLMEAIQAQLRSAPEVATELLRLSSFVYRTEAVQSQIAASKQWNQQLNQQKQLSQQSHLRDIDELLSYSAQQVVQSLAMTVPESSLEATDTPASVVAQLDQMEAFVTSTRKAISHIHNDASRSRLERLVRTWEDLTREAKLRTSALTRMSTALAYVERAVDASIVSSPLWDILESQETLHRSADRAVSSAAVTEDGWLQENEQLVRSKASLELALAVAAGGLCEDSGDSWCGASGAASPTQIEAQLEKQIRAATSAVAQKQARRDAVRREVVALRRAVRSDSGEQALGTHQPNQRVAPAVAEARRVLAWSLLDHVTKQLAEQLPHLASTTDENAAAVLCDAAVEVVETQQRDINSLLADNASLWQQLQDIRFAEAVAVEPEKASNLAQAVLLQCGVPLEPKQNEEESLTSLRQIEDRVLQTFSTCMQKASDAVTRSLSEIESICLSPRRQLLQDVEVLAQLLYVRMEAIDGAATKAKASHALEQLRHKLRVCRSRPRVSYTASCTSHRVPVSFISTDALDAARTQLATVAEQSQTEIQGLWSTLDDECTALTEKLQWFALHPLDAVEAELDAAGERRNELERQLGDTKASQGQKQRALREVVSLASQLDVLVSQKLPELEESTADAEQRVARLQVASLQWQLFRDEQSQRHTSVCAEEAVEFARIADVFSRVGAALSAAQAAESAETAASPSHDAAAEEQPIKAEDLPLVKEETEALEDTSSLPIEPPAFGADTFTHVKEENPDDADAEGIADGERTAETKMEASSPSFKEEEEGTEAPVLSPGTGDDEAHLASKEEAHDAGAASEENQPKPGPLSDTVELRNEEDGGEEQGEEAEQGEDSPVSSGPHEDTQDIPSDVQPAERENGDDPFFSGFGFGDD